MCTGKAFFRHMAENGRKALSPEQIASSDLNIKNNILTLCQYREAKTVFCFVGTDGEIDTTEIILDALAQKKRLCVPKCISRGVMEAFEIKSFEDLDAGKYGIMEPKDYCLRISPEEIDFAIIPCVTCDTNGNRIGRGEGYYDRYLKNVGFTTAVLCRHALLSGGIQAEENDVRVDIVVTDKSVHTVIT